MTRTLLVYFSRAGENYYYGGRRDLAVGNTQVLAERIRALVDCDVHQIDAVEPYPAGYDATVQRNTREKDADARPSIANPLESIDAYDTILIGSPIWSVRTPMIMATFTEAYDFTGKTLLPFVTYAVSGAGSARQDYATAAPAARVGEVLAVQGEEVEQSGADVERWLQAAGLMT